MKPVTALMGAIFGGLLTLPLMALLYLADQAGLPLVMYDLFDWLARVLPGDIIINSIETMVRIINDLNLGATDTTAKTIENLSALAMFLGIGIVTGAILFVALERWGARLNGAARFVPGLIAGLIVAVPVILISRDVNVTAEASGATSAAWITIAFAAWGALLSWAYARWAAAGAPAPDDSDAIPVHAEPISRRDFLIRVGGATATITVVGAGLARLLEVRDERAYEDLIAERREAVLFAPRLVLDGCGGWESFAFDRFAWCGEDGAINAVPPRPTRMWRRTYARIVAEIERRECMAMEELASWMMKLSRRSRTRGFW